jgi:hypothetical protein
MLALRQTYRRQTRRQSAEVMYIAHLRHHALVAFSRAEKALLYWEGCSGKVITLDQALAS